MKYTSISMPNTTVNIILPHISFLILPLNSFSLCSCSCMFISMDIFSARYSSAFYRFFLFSSFCYSSSSLLSSFSDAGADSSILTVLRLFFFFFFLSYSESLSKSNLVLLFTLLFFAIFYYLGYLEFYFAFWPASPGVMLNMLFGC